tara:strand:+ start:635 stop:1273 length:639 start_codon:yes stop_codon:yes gene_type:complete
MKVKIKKEGKIESFNLINSWSDVTLEAWVKLTKETGSKTEEAEETIAALSDIPKKLIKELPLRDAAIIMGKIAELQSEQDTVLKKVFEIDGVEYGMHPNLDDITLGEYADLETFIKNGIEDNMPEIMAVLFRPVTERNGEAYTIGAYDGNLTIRAEQFKKMSAEQVQSALVFFWHLGSESLKILPSYLMERAEEIMKELQTKTLPNAGDGSE